MLVLFNLAEIHSWSNLQECMAYQVEMELSWVMLAKRSDRNTLQKSRPLSVERAYYEACELRTKAFQKLRHSLI